MLAAAAPLLTSCLVTESVDFPEEENLPPSIISAPSARELGTALDQIIRINLDEDVDGARELEIPVIVRDPNVQQDLDYVVLRDFAEGSLNTDTELRRSELLGGDASGSIDRELTLIIGWDELGSPGQCHKLELLVSGGFAPGLDLRQPAVAGDIAQAVWWIRLVDEATASASVPLGLCP